MVHPLVFGAVVALVVFSVLVSQSQIHGMERVAQAERVVAEGAHDIVSARERVARLLSIAKELLSEVQHLQENPEECAPLKARLKEGEELQLMPLRGRSLAAGRERACDWYWYWVGD